MLAWFSVASLFSASAMAALEVDDDAGRTVALTAPAERVVALAPHIVELLYAVGAGERVVGALEGSDFPRAARDIPRVGSYRGIALEAIMAREPDLVVTWRSGTPRSVVTASRRWAYRSTPASRGDSPTWLATCATWGVCRSRRGRACGRGVRGASRPLGNACPRRRACSINWGDTR